MFKLIAIVINFGLLIVMFFLLGVSVYSYSLEPGILLFIPFLLLNLFAIIFGNESDLLSLYFKRKVMEEKKKILEIKVDDK